MLNSICPIFPSANFKKTTDFFRKLGFNVAFEYDEEGYLILVRDKIELHFASNPDHDAPTSNHSAFVRVTDANDLSRQFALSGLPIDGIPRVTKAEDKPWGVCELAVIDPDGNLLRIGHNL